MKSSKNGGNDWHRASYYTEQQRITEAYRHMNESTKSPRELNYMKKNREFYNKTRKDISKSTWSNPAHDLDWNRYDRMADLVNQDHREEVARSRRVETFDAYKIIAANLNNAIKVVFLPDIVGQALWSIYSFDYEDSSIYGDEYDLADVTGIAALDKKKLFDMLHLDPQCIYVAGCMGDAFALINVDGEWKIEREVEANIERHGIPLPDMDFAAKLRSLFIYR